MEYNKTQLRNPRFALLRRLERQKDKQEKIKLIEKNKLKIAKSALRIDNFEEEPELKIKNTRLHLLDRRFNR